MLASHLAKSKGNPVQQKPGPGVVTSITFMISLLNPRIHPFPLGGKT